CVRQPLGYAYGQGSLDVW
nr:immunoglobulin heavy chain junction region [Macaca mulatta]MOY23502.1 immunoglobulin heavy chain junction region [Macaca mulatta]MOY27335.1 immunoglobulin heavy chain junction region [Macaca mulatta]MOY30485.1 immunoglobulin heavy chain junction region [Macaca mulatta]